MRSPRWIGLTPPWKGWDYRDSGIERRAAGVPQGLSTRVVSFPFEITKPQVFGVAVVWNRSDGAIEVIFAERNTEFSDEGTRLLRNLIEELRKMYGDRTVVDANDAA
jgi:hypothetical protein